MGTANILVVCTGNVCRSPAAALLLAHRLGPAASEYSIHSAGVRAVTGARMDATMRDLLARRGIEVTDAFARELTVSMVDSADLILTASTSHRAAVVRMLPRAVRKTLTLKQLARYAPIIPPSPGSRASATERVERILAALPLARAHAPEGEDSIADPLGRSRRRYRAAVDQLDEACTMIAALLRDQGAAPVVPASPDSWWSEVSTVELSVPASPLTD